MTARCVTRLHLPTLFGRKGSDGVWVVYAPLSTAKKEDQGELQDDIVRICCRTSYADSMNRGRTASEWHARFRLQVVDEPGEIKEEQHTSREANSRQQGIISCRKVSPEQVATSNPSPALAVYRSSLTLLLLHTHISPLHNP